MSHFTEMKINFLQENEAELIAALRAEFGAKAVKVSDKGMSHKGVYGEKLEDCHILVPSKDIGYQRTKDGKYVGFVDTFIVNKDVQNKIAQDYTVGVTMKTVKKNGYIPKQVKLKDGSIRIVATKIVK